MHVVLLKSVRVRRLSLEFSRALTVIAGLGSRSGLLGRRGFGAAAATLFGDLVRIIAWLESDYCVDQTTVRCL